MDVRRRALDAILAAGGRPVARAEAGLEAASPGDRALHLELLTGPFRHRSTLDALVDAVSRRPAAMTDPVVLEILRQALHQLVYLRQIPPWAAVDCAVDMARERAGAPASRYVNAVLRRIGLSLRREQGAGPAPRDRRTIFVEPGEWVTFSIDVLPDSATEPLRWLSVQYSCPLWLVERFHARLGPDGCEALLIAGNRRPAVTIRVNRLRAAVEDVLRRLDDEGIGWHHDQERGVISLHLDRDLRGVKAFREGLFTVQGPAAMAVAPFVAPRSGSRVLDLCAAPGGKATHLAELMDGSGEVVAADVSGPRLRLIAENRDRLGLSCITIHDLGPLGTDLPHGPFDAVLVDAPCTNSGVLSRRVEARWRIGPGAVARLRALQQHLLARAAALVRPGGILVYSVCSVLAEEEPDTPSGAVESARATLWPHETGHDGGFMARWIVERPPAERSEAAGFRRPHGG